MDLTLNPELCRQVEQYFAAHLQGEIYLNLPVAKQQGVLQCAYRMLLVLLERTTLDLTDELNRAAWLEQTIYLIDRYQAGSVSPGVAAETISGVGSVSYLANGEKNSRSGDYSPLALKFLAAELPPVKLGRG